MENTQISRRKIVAGAAWAAPVVAASAAVPAFASSTEPCTDLGTTKSIANSSTHLNNAAVVNTYTASDSTTFTFDITGGAGGGTRDRNPGGQAANVTGTLNLKAGDVVTVVVASGGTGLADAKDVFSATDTESDDVRTAAKLAWQNGTEGGRGYGNGGDTAALRSVLYGSNMPSAFEAHANAIQGWEN